MGLGDLITTASVVLGFQVGLLTWRIRREADMKSNDKQSWFPIADWVNVLSISVFGIGTLLVPVLRSVVWGHQEDQVLAAGAKMFGLGVLLLVVHLLATVGHYELFRKSAAVQSGSPESTGEAKGSEYFPLQERVVVAVGLVAVFGYLLLLLFVPS